MTGPRHLFLIAPLLLAACEGAEVLSPADTATGGGGDGAEAAAEPQAEEQSSEQVAMAGTGWLAVGADGSVYTTHFDADGTYRDYRNGEFVQQGEWQRREDGRLCFTPADEARLGACWETKGLKDDGTMRARDADGRAIELRRVTYLPPAAEQSADAEGEEEGAAD
ncbi:hypothetical protein [Erythrobacter sp.]|uniref:hypothetical protein n=1 Tax=Erythrobacter sp. TaxID=1042 RepID=UPI001425E6E7|nr:hypothetical protein [Erythrobacter sp.]QIQ87276.1 MAG: hypothetical protein G9473_11715 [Erythrobacter sp.]